MVLLPDNKKTTEYQIESKIIKSSKPRSYLGMSGIGNECLRAQWYSWRWYSLGKISARINRIFTRGHLEESSIIGDLIEIGCNVFRREGKEKIPMTGSVDEEQEEIIGYQSHCKGHPDGRITGVIEAPKAEHLLEMKTMKDSKFQDLKEKGLVKAFPGYAAQIQIYMGRLKLKRTLFIATNKDTQARKYLRFKFDKPQYEILSEREKNIILSEVPPTKKWLAESYNCRFCGHLKVCHLNASANRTCRSCEHCDVMMDGKWGCHLLHKKLSYRKQLRGCGKYKELR